MSNRLEVGWTFTPLFLIKDSLAVMLEAAGGSRWGRAWPAWPCQPVACARPCLDPARGCLTLGVGT